VENILTDRKNSNALNKWILLFLAIVLLSIALLGTSLAGWWSQSVWPLPASKNDFFIFVISAFFLYFLLLIFGVSFGLLLLIPLSIYIGSAGFGPVAAVLWFWACATFIGAALGSLIRIHCESVWDLRYSAIGFAVIGVLVSACAHFPICSPLFFFAFFSVQALVAIYWLTRKGQSPFPINFSLKPIRRSFSENILTAFVVLGITLVVVVTMLPDLGHDALAMHLNIPARMMTDGYWKFDVKQYVWAVMPFGADWLYVPPYFLAGEQGARLLNSSFLLAVGLASYRLLSIRIGAVLALAAPALLFTWPLSLLEVGTAFIEAPLAFFFMICLVELAASERTKGQWIALGIAAGYACFIKLLGFLILPFLLIGALIRSRSGKFEAPTRTLLVFGVLVFLIFCLSPYLVAFVKTGNPVFPFFNKIFQSPYFHTDNSFTNILYVRKIGFQTLWDMSISSTSFGEFSAPGAIGITLIVLLPLSLLAAAGNRHWGIFACSCAAIAYVMLCFYNQAYLRYAFPVLPWLLITGVWAMSRLAWPKISTTILVMIFCSISLARFPVAYWPFQQFELQLLWSKAANSEFFIRSQPQAIAGDIISAREDLSGSKIAILGVGPTYNHFPSGTVADSWHSTEFTSKSMGAKNLQSVLAQSSIGIIVFPIGRGYKYESEAIALSRELFTIRDIRVGAVIPEKIFTHELLKNPDLTLTDVGWNIDDAMRVSGGVRASVDKPITQLVNVESIDSMMLTTQVSCPQGQSFRTQVNWGDRQHKLISTDIKVHACSPEGVKVERGITKPDGAVEAVVYGGSHDSRPVTVNRISLRTAE
jgi:hypothetical protein